jgi:hypothetical protein
MSARFVRRRRLYLVPSTCALALCAIAIIFDRSHAQSGKITLISEETSTRAVAIDAVTLQHEPFNATSDIKWGNDNRTRIMMFAMGLAGNASPAEVVATAQDGANRTYNLSVEYLGPVPEQNWITAIVLRLDDQMNDLADVLIGITYKGVISNRVRGASVRWAMDHQMTRARRRRRERHRHQSRRQRPPDLYLRPTCRPSSRKPSRPLPQSTTP